MANSISTKQQIHISVDIGLAEQVKLKGFNLSAICNTGLINAVAGYIPLSKEELEELKWNLQQTTENRDELLDTHNKLLQNYDALKKTAIQKLDELKQAISQKEAQAQRQQETIDLHRSEIEKLTAKTMASSKATDRLEEELSIKEEEHSKEIKDINQVHKSEKNTLMQQITKLETTITKQQKEGEQQTAELYNKFRKELEYSDKKNKSLEAEVYHYKTPRNKLKYIAILILIPFVVIGIITGILAISKPAISTGSNIIQSLVSTLSGLSGSISNFLHNIK
jgi:hypothetical protein